MIFAKTWHKIYDLELLTIVKILKTCDYYLDNCKFKVMILINYNNLDWLIDIKNLSSYQV